MEAEKIGRSIAFLRKSFSMTQKDLADRLDVTDKAVSRWERGIGMPDISILTKLATVLDTDIEAILEGNFTHDETDCKGLLVMRYPEGIEASTFIYTKRVVYFQLSFFLLTGIREICIRGKNSDVDFTREKLGDGKSLGIRIFYEPVSDSIDDDYTKSDFFSTNNIDSSFLIINGLDFLYGKDITSSLKRIIFDSVFCTTAVNYKKKPLSFTFFPRLYRQNTFGNNSENFMMGRGVICFPIKNEKDLFDASALVKIIEEQHHEKIADLAEIAKSRGFI